MTSDLKPQKPDRKLIKPRVLGSILFAAIFLYGFACLALSRWQNYFIFFPQAEIYSTPSDFDLKFEEVYLDFSSSQRVHGWWMPNSGTKTLLYLHGNGANIAANIEHAKRFHRLGFSVLLIDYRGYGKSIGDFPTEESVYADSELAWDYLVKQRKISPQNILIYGHSLGGAIAIDLAVKQPLAKGLIVESSFSSIAAMVKRDPKFIIFPIDLLVHQRFDSISKVRSLSMPVLFLHGTSDSVIPFSMSEQLYAETKSRIKKIFLIPKANHNNNAATGGDRYLQVLREFIQVTDK
jgi:uncharacterized protein